ncbi:hypothetical protein SAMN04488065_1641 [Haloplanus vescus]|uniref:Uncharacterized protein n=1 Tax=Haloplanus vescus TaxID=555874 RepID=A0A1H3Y5T6_9EURY|nr:DUF5778 family protein [Haloplanus vescus]SEA06192.1 hypothetical protein SAMN04488065_1641 [Haloplanus vescus]
MSSQSDVIDDDLYRRTKSLLEPGDIDLAGAIVHTDLSGQEDLEMQELTVELNEVIAAHAGKGETYIHAGNDDPNFSSNQFQGRTLDGDEFVWECQQLLREGTFDIVFYYEADADQEALVEDINDRGYDVTSVVLDEDDEMSASEV